MRNQFVECESFYEAFTLCPWAVVVAKTDGGYWCFEDGAEYLKCKDQL